MKHIKLYDNFDWSDDNFDWSDDDFDFEEESENVYTKIMNILCVFI